MHGIRQLVNDKLRTIQGLQSEQPLINCGTCRQGKPLPNSDWQEIQFPVILLAFLCID